MALGSAAVGTGLMTALTGVCLVAALVSLAALVAGTVLSAVDAATLALDSASSIQATCWSPRKIIILKNSLGIVTRPFYGADLVARMPFTKSGMNSAPAFSGKPTWQGKHLHESDNALSVVDAATLALDSASSIQVTRWTLRK